MRALYAEVNAAPSHSLGFVPPPGLHNKAPGLAQQRPVPSAQVGPVLKAGFPAVPKLAQVHQKRPAGDAHTHVPSLGPGRSTLWISNKLLQICARVSLVPATGVNAYGEVALVHRDCVLPPPSAHSESVPPPRAPIPHAP